MPYDTMTRPPRRPTRRGQAAASAREILEGQYEEGLRTLELPWARDALERVQEACPKLPWEDTVRLFARRTADGPETVLQAALFLDWNRAHAQSTKRRGR